MFCVFALREQTLLWFRLRSISVHIKSRSLSYAPRGGYCSPLTHRTGRVIKKREENVG